MELLLIQNRFNLIFVSIFFFILENLHFISFVFQFHFITLQDETISGRIRIQPSSSSTSTVQQVPRIKWNFKISLISTFLILVQFLLQNLRKTWFYYDYCFNVTKDKNRTWIFNIYIYFFQAKTSNMKCLISKILYCNRTVAGSEAILCHRT